MLRYPVALTSDDNGTVLVGFPDFPEAHTFGDTADEALARAVDALETVIEGYMRAKRDVPAPTETEGATVALPALVAAKIDIYRLMRARQVNKTELAKRLDVHLPQVDRLLDLRHGSRVEQLEAAARALGAQCSIVFVVNEGTVTVVDVRRTKRRASPAARSLHRAASHTVHAGVLTRAKTSGSRRATASVGGTKKK